MTWILTIIRHLKNFDMHYVTLEVSDGCFRFQALRKEVYIVVNGPLCSKERQKLVDYLAHQSKPNESFWDSVVDNHNDTICHLRQNHHLNFLFTNRTPHFRSHWPSCHIVWIFLLFDVTQTIALKHHAFHSTWMNFWRIANEDNTHPSSNKVWNVSFHYCKVHHSNDGL